MGHWGRWTHGTVIYLPASGLGVCHGRAWVLSSRESVGRLHSLEDMFVLVLEHPSHRELRAKSQMSVKELKVRSLNLACDPVLKSRVSSRCRPVLGCGSITLISELASWLHRVQRLHLGSGLHAGLSFVALLKIQRGKLVTE